MITLSVALFVAAQQKLPAREVFPNGFADKRGEVSLDEIALLKSDSKIVFSISRDNSKEMREHDISPKRVKFIYDDLRTRGRLVEFPKIIHSWLSHQMSNKKKSSYVYNLSAVYANVLLNSYLSSPGAAPISAPQLRSLGDAFSLKVTDSFRETFTSIVIGQDILLWKLRPMVNAAKAKWPDEKFFYFAACEEYMKAYGSVSDNEKTADLAKNTLYVEETARVGLKKWPSYNVLNLYLALSLEHRDLAKAKTQLKLYLTNAKDKQSVRYQNARTKLNSWDSTR